MLKPPDISVFGVNPPKQGRGTGGRPRNGEEHLTLAAREPWKAEGISRKTWFRRRAKEKAK